MINEFRPIPGYITYEINPEGIIRTIERRITDKIGRKYLCKSRIIKCRIDRAGYIITKLTKPDKRYGSQYVHRLVAQTFIPNDNNKPMVNHIDFDKTNCHVSNLEWVTKSENMQHARSRSTITARRYKVPVHNMCTGKLYSSMKEAAVANNLPYHILKQTLRVIGHYRCLKRLQAAA